MPTSDDEFEKYIMMTEGSGPSTNIYKWQRAMDIITSSHERRDLGIEGEI